MPLPAPAISPSSSNAASNASSTSSWSIGSPTKVISTNTTVLRLTRLTWAVTALGRAVTRTQHPRRRAAAVAFLASTDARFITRAIVPVDSGAIATSGPELICPIPTPTRP
ncbi:hypothetical protein GCM10010431_55020 [Streptomyces kunmingensis]